MTSPEHYTLLLKELVLIRRDIEKTESGREVPSKLFNLVDYAAQEAAIQLQSSREPIIAEASRDPQ
jgi:hypothetical protein